MLRRTLLLALGAGLFLQAQPRLQAQPPARTQPKLVLTVVVDQFRFDYLTRFESEYQGGLKRLWDQGAVMVNANYESAPTVTAVGHATILSGALPSVSGIIGNTWWDRETSKSVMSITDDSAAGLGGAANGASPRRLLVSTIADELKLSGKGGKTFGVSLKDRSAILPVGHTGDGAFWFDGRSGNFVSSDYYFPAMPAWVNEFNAAQLADQFAGREWMGETMPASGGALYRAIDASPFGDEIVHQFALKLLQAEQLGMRDKIDLLSVSYSSVDYVGHNKGPDAPEIHDMVLRVDRLIGELITAAERQAGTGNVLVVFTADHGIPPLPEQNAAVRMPGGRIDAQAERRALEAALVEEFGEGEYIASVGEGNYYFKSGIGVDPVEMENVAAAVLRAQPHVARVYTRSQLLNGAVSGDRIDQRIRNGFNAERSGDLFVLHEPYFQAGRAGTAHGSPYSYDTHVPVVFLGMPGWIRGGRYYRDAGVQDIAPTLSAILGIPLPTGASGRVLDEILQ